MGEGNLCRLCAVQKECFVGIYDDEGYKLNLESKITKCLQIELYPKDPLPKSVCLDCCAKLNQCSDFFEASSAAQVTLHMIFPDTKKEETEEEEEKKEENQHPESAPEPELELEPEPLPELEPELCYEPENDSSMSMEEETCKAEPKTQEYTESVLSEKQGNKEENGVNDALPALASRRKRRVPVRFTTLQEQVNTKENTERPRRRTRRGRVKTVADTAELKLEDELAEPKEEETEMDVIDDFVLPSLEPPDEEQDLPEKEEENAQEIPAVVKKKQRGGWDMYPWICSDCSQELPSLEALRNHHQVEHNQLPRYMCAQCSKVYDKYYGFVSHVRRHRNHMKFICEECGKCFSNKKVLESHRATHSDVRPYVCLECGKSFRQQSALYVHNRSHQPDEVKNRYPCDQCDKRFSTKPNLVTHKRIHTGIRNFTCDQCGKSFIQKGNLDSHLLTHSSDKPHSCPICNKGFKTPLQLRKHQTVHTGAKPHQCDVCGRQFRERGTLREHHRIHTGAMPFTCEFCGKSFRFKGILTTHRRQHTGERPYSCLECQHHFTNWPNYNKHMKRRHGINTSHQPDPNKLAVAAAAAAAEMAAAAAGVSVDSLQQLPSMMTVSNMNTHGSNMYNSQTQNTTHLNALVDPQHQQQHSQPQQHQQQQQQTSQQQQQQQQRGITMQFYNPAPIYGSGTLPPSAMLGFYNLPQLQQTMDISTLDMLHTVQQR